MNQVLTQECPAKEPFVRNRLIWLYYSLCGLNCYIMSALGPIMPFLRSELNLNYQVAGLHFSAFALGAIAAGLSGDQVFKRLGRVNTLCFGVAGTVMGLASFIIGPSAVVTIAGILVAGYCTNITYQTLATVISGHLSELRTFAFVEAEVSAMLGALVAPFAVSFFVSAKAGWRASLIILAVAFLATLPALKIFGTARVAEVKEHETPGPLPLVYWTYATVILLSVAAEWSTAFWSADYLYERLHITKALAAATVGAFFAGMFIGRSAGAKLVRTYSSDKMLLASGLISIIGFGLFWLAECLPLNVLGLFLTGLGIANMYPLSFAGAVNSAEHQANKAIARMSLMGGSALLVAPLGLSFIADRTGLFGAYGTVTGVLVLCFIAIICANKSTANGAAARSIH